MKWFLAVCVLISSRQVIAELPYPPGHRSDLWAVYHHTEPFPEKYFLLSGGYAACVSLDSETSFWTPGIVHCDTNNSKCACHSASDNQSFISDEFLILKAPSDLHLSEPGDIDPAKRLRFEVDGLVYGFCIVEDPETKSVIAGFVVENNNQCVVSGVAYDRYKEFQLARKGLGRYLLSTIAHAAALMVGAKTAFLMIVVFAATTAPMLVGTIMAVFYLFDLAWAVYRYAR